VIVRAWQQAVGIVGMPAAMSVCQPAVTHQLTQLHPVSNPPMLMCTCAASSAFRRHSLSQPSNHAYEAKWYLVMSCMSYMRHQQSHQLYADAWCMSYDAACMHAQRQHCCMCTVCWLLAYLLYVVCWQKLLICWIAMQLYVYILIIIASQKDSINLTNQV
jgi:hypothetical protein